MAFVYWIHKPEDTDMFEAGYIGFTSDTVVSRYKEHKALAKTGSRNYPIYNAINKYGDLLVVDTLVEGSNEYCLDVEYKLRPSPNIGWNISCGGGAPMLGLKHKPETIEKMKADARRPEKRKKMSDRAKAIPVWMHGSSDELLWSSADIIYDCYSEHENIGPVLLARAFGLSHKKLEAMHKRLSKGWNPRDDQEWVKWSESKTKITSGWRKGDTLMEAKKPEITPELSAKRAKGGASRVWTPEMRENLSKKNLGRKMSPEAIAKNVAARLGTHWTESQREVLKKRLAERPWTNATAVHSNWALAEYFKSSIEAGKLVSELLRELDLPRKSMQLSKIIKKIKAGWNPSEDAAYLSWLSEYKEKQKENYGT